MSLSSRAVTLKLIVEVVYEMFAGRLMVKFGGVVSADVADWTSIPINVLFRFPKLSFRVMFTE